MAANGNRELAGKVALVTGAGRLRGIGRAAAVALARLGADVAVSGTGRDPATFPVDEKAVGWRDVDSVAEAIVAEGSKALALRFDVSDQEQTDAAVARIVSELGRIDILINNAAIARGEDRTPVQELDPNLFQRVVDVKVRGSFLCTQAVIRHIDEQG
ncbi:MAG: SDR family NAD(P)-dependent oxidoreductase, partial [Gammaproteobacteria bacterium]|nr:SDR family NAD(P)-dependent oxidoreductase [Gammaproteobacteria bacterium]